MAEPHQAVTNAEVGADLRSLHKELADLRDKVSGLEKDRDSALRWGILALGSAVIGLTGLIGKFVMSKLP